MPINIYIVSTQDFSGKSAVSVALMSRMKQDGHRVGYLKPVSSAARVAEEGIDEDARLVKETFHLTEPLDILAPIVLTEKNLEEVLSTGVRNYAVRVKEAAEVVGQDKDVVIVEGGTNLREGYVVDLSPAETAALLDARVVAIVGYRNSLQVVDDALTAQTRLGERLVGVLINSIPENRQDYVDNLITPYLTEQQVNVLAALPYQKNMHSVDIGQLVGGVNGKLICCGNMHALVENLVVASTGIEHSLEKFRQIENKAVIVGADRPDIQIDALETSTKALILTGNLEPTPQIKERAELQDTAIILSPYDTLATIEKVETIFNRSRFHQIEKIKCFERLLKQRMNFRDFYLAIGLLS